MTDHTPPTDQQLDGYEQAARNAARIGSGIDPAAVLELAAEVRRLRAELAHARANGIRYAADLVTNAFHSEPFLSYPPDFADLLRDHAARLTAAAPRAAAVVVPAVVETGEAGA